MQDLRIDISSALYREGGKVVTPDKDGVYKDIPMMVIGKPSRNSKIYETTSMMEAITSDSSIFYRKLVGGQLEGEFNHPLIWKEEDLPRVMLIDRDRLSHRILRVYTKATEQGNTILYGDIKCCGPKGKYLAESFADPQANTAFSLRSVVSVLGKTGNFVKQKVLALITIDAVDCPGYAEASKVYVQGLEGLSLPFNVKQMMPQVAKLVGAESATDQQLLDILEADKVTINHSIRGMVDVRTNSIVTDNGNKSLFHTVFNMRG